MGNFFKAAYIALLMAACPSVAMSATFYKSETIDSFCSFGSGGYCEQASLPSPPPLSSQLDLNIYAPVKTASDGVFKFTAWGDFNRPDEYVIVAVEGFMLGAFLNDDPSDDLFSDDGYGLGTWVDRGNEYGGPRAGLNWDGTKWTTCPCDFQPARVGTAIIPLDELAIILFDEIITVSMWFAPGVSNGPLLTGQHVVVEEFVSASISFETATADVPAPPAIVLLLLALTAFPTFRRSLSHPHVR